MYSSRQALVAFPADGSESPCAGSKTATTPITAAKTERRPTLTTAKSYQTARREAALLTNPLEDAERSARLVGMMILGERRSQRWRPTAAEPPSAAISKGEVNAE
jgi:hypothetical protein